MSHNTFGKKLSRDTGQRQALLKGLAGALIRSEAIETTEAKAQAARNLIERLITLAKKGGIGEVREIESVIVDRDLTQKLVQQIAPRFKNRNGGYLRLIKKGNRVGDNAPMVRMELVDGSVVTPAPVLAKTESKAEPKTKPSPRKKAVVVKKKPASKK
jgi:large subunit ribosomal protein L17